jgi:tetratricopeptide (TPR) repeat protein
VVPHPAPKPPDPELRDLFSAGLSRKANGDLDGAVLFWEQILQRDPDFEGGIVLQEMKMILDHLRPIRIQRLTQLADTAAAAGQWGQEIGSWEALLLLDSRNNYAKLRKSIAIQNQQSAWMYEDAGAMLEKMNRKGAKEQLNFLYSRARDYGDPLGYAARVQLGPKQDRGTKDRARLDQQMTLETQLIDLESEKQKEQKHATETTTELEKLIDFNENYQRYDFKSERETITITSIIATLIGGVLVFWNSHIWASLGVYWLSDLLGNVIRLIGYFIIATTISFLCGNYILAGIWYQYRLASNIKKRDESAKVLKASQAKIVVLDNQIAKSKELIDQVKADLHR